MSETKKPMPDWLIRKRKAYCLRPGEKIRALAGYAIRTHDEVAAIMGISKQRVGQIERIAMAKIRKALKKEAREYFNPGVLQ